MNSDISNASTIDVNPLEIYARNDLNIPGYSQPALINKESTNFISKEYLSNYTGNDRNLKKN